MELKGKVAIVTGAARGLGKCAVEELLVRGVKMNISNQTGDDKHFGIIIGLVCFCDVNVEGGEATFREFVETFGESNVVFKACDASKENEIKDLIETTKEKFQGLDIYINNAAIVDDEKWEKMMDVNLGSCIRGTRMAIEHFRMDKGGKGGVILNVASLAGITVEILEPCYTASKHAIIGFSKALALQQHIKDNGIRIVCLCPNMIATPLLLQYNEKATGYRKRIIDKKVSEIGVLSIKTVVEGIIKILQDEDNNAKELVVDPGFGIEYRNVIDPAADRYLAAQML